MAQMSNAKDRTTELSAALLRIVADRGLDQVSVREVAAEAGVSIGTVQHYFPTKDDMLAAAFGAVVAGVRDRLAGVRLGTDIRRNLALVLRELLPLDERRRREVVVQLAFSTRAAHVPNLAAIQRDVLSEIHAGLAEAFAIARGARRADTVDRRAAHVALATADGLAQHAVSAPGLLGPGRLGAALDAMLDALLRFYGRAE